MYLTRVCVCVASFAQTSNAVHVSRGPGEVSFFLCTYLLRITHPLHLVYHNNNSDKSTIGAGSNQVNKQSTSIGRTSADRHS